MFNLHTNNVLIKLFTCVEQLLNFPGHGLDVIFESPGSGWGGARRTPGGYPRTPSGCWDAHRTSAIHVRKALEAVRIQGGGSRLPAGF